MAILLREATRTRRSRPASSRASCPASRTARPLTFRNRNAHAWVEVYFPAYGWIPFDPTGGGVGIPSVLIPRARS